MRVSLIRKFWVTLLFSPGFCLTSKLIIDLLNFTTLHNFRKSISLSKLLDRSRFFKTGQISTIWISFSAVWSEKLFFLKIIFWKFSVLIKFLLIQFLRDLRASWFSQFFSRERVFIFFKWDIGFRIAVKTMIRLFFIKADKIDEFRDSVFYM